MFQLSIFVILNLFDSKRNIYKVVQNRTANFEIGANPSKTQHTHTASNGPSPSTQTALAGLV